MTPEQHQKLMADWRLDLEAMDYGAVPAKWEAATSPDTRNLLAYSAGIHLAAARRIIMRLYDRGMPAGDIGAVWGLRPQSVFDYVQQARKTVTLRVICDGSRHDRFSSAPSGE